jgi:hypothetical protein
LPASGPTPTTHPGGCADPSTNNKKRGRGRPKGYRAAISTVTTRVRGWHVDECIAELSEIAESRNMLHPDGTPWSPAELMTEYYKQHTDEWKKMADEE